jgi:hypothetical protein
MQCPYCQHHFHEQWRWQQVQITENNDIYGVDGKAIRALRTPCCKSYVVQYHDTQGIDTRSIEVPWRMVEPIGANRGPVSAYVPAAIRDDYIEACNVLPLSAKASAALSRRCLQNILHEQGYRAKDLNREIDLLLNESDTSKSVPSSLRTTIDGIRNFGNFSAHPIADRTSLEIIDVEPEEAEWCLEILEGLFDHFYVQPQIAAEKKARLDAKLAAAGKPASK